MGGPSLSGVTRKGGVSAQDDLKARFNSFADSAGSLRGEAPDDSQVGGSGGKGSSPPPGNAGGYLLPPQ